MKKNNLIIYILCSAIIIGIFSCADELEINPTSELESEYFESEIRIQEGVLACYASLANMYGPLLNDGGGVHELLFLPGDDVTHQDAGRATFEAFSGLNSSNGKISNTWSRLYQMVYRCNFILEKIEEDDIKAVYQTEALYEINKGEALFLRSWAFYRLWDLFRKAPLQDHRIRTIEDAILPPSEGFEMLDKAIEDLEYAAAILPNEEYWSAETERGRVFKESAYGLLVKSYVLRARYNQGNTDDYNKAIAAFEKITTRELVHFAENFDFNYENNAESLFEFQASHAIEQDNAWLDNNFGGGVGQMGAMYHYNTSHWGNYETGIYGPTSKLMESFEDGDPRSELTAANYTTNVDGNVNVPAGPWNKFNGFQLMKYVTPGRCWFEPTWGISSTNNTRLIRYGDIKLLAAEAYLQTGNQTNALQQLNDIRERARRSTSDESVSIAPTNLTSVTIQDIINERFVELAAEEGIRWSDLRSWHAAGYINLASWTAADFGYNYDESNFELELPKHLLFPIPQSEMDRNPLMASSGNNPGY